MSSRPVVRLSVAPGTTLRIGSPGLAMSVWINATVCGIRRDRRRVRRHGVEQRAPRDRVRLTRVSSGEACALPEIGIGERAAVHGLGEVVRRLCLVDDRDRIVVLGADQNVVSDARRGVRAGVEAVDVELLAGGIGETIEQREVDLVDDVADRAAVDRTVQRLRLRRVPERGVEWAQVAAARLQPIRPIPLAARVTRALIVRDVKVSRPCSGSRPTAFASPRKFIERLHCKNTCQFQS